jgi:hypothetical protein
MLTHTIIDGSLAHHLNIFVELHQGLFIKHQLKSIGVHVESKGPSLNSHDTHHLVAYPLDPSSMQATGLYLAQVLAS